MSKNEAIESGELALEALEAAIEQALFLGQDDLADAFGRVYNHILMALQTNLLESDDDYKKWEEKMEELEEEMVSQIIQSECDVFKRTIH